MALSSETFLAAGSGKIAVLYYYFLSLLAQNVFQELKAERIKRFVRLFVHVEVEVPSERILLADNVLKTWSETALLDGLCKLDRLYSGSFVPDAAVADSLEVLGNSLYDGGGSRLLP